MLGRNLVAHVGEYLFNPFNAGIMFLINCNYFFYHYFYTPIVNAFFRHVWPQIVACQGTSEKLQIHASIII